MIQPQQPEDNVEYAEVPVQQEIPAVQLTGIEARYEGGMKHAGDVIYSSELYVMAYYSDGTAAEIRDGWDSSDVGMLLSEGPRVVTLNYGGMSSSFELGILPAEEPEVMPTTAPGGPAEGPAYADPQPEEPAYVEPQPEETVYVEPQPEQPVYTEPQPEETAYVEPQPEQPVYTEPQMVGIVAGYRGGQKYEGEMIYGSELYVNAYYDNDTTVTINEGWGCNEVGMTLAAGEKVVTMYYGSFSSSFSIIVLPRETQPQPQPEQPCLQFGVTVSCCARSYSRRKNAFVTPQSMKSQGNNSSSALFLVV